MAEVLAPSLHGFNVATCLLAKLGQRLAERVRVEIGQSRPLERVLD